MRLLIVSLWFLAVIALMLPSAGAVTLNYYGIEDTINDDLSVHNVVTLKFDSPINHLEYVLDFKIYNFDYDYDFDLADCSLDDYNGKSRVTCDFIGMTKEKNMLKLEFDARNVIRKTDEGYRFLVNYGISLPIKRAFVLIKLPVNGMLAADVANQSYSPSSGNIITDGKRIMVYWEEENLNSGDNLRFSVLYSTPPNIDPVFVAAITLIVIAAMAGMAVYLKRGEHGEDMVEKAVKSVLNRDEKRVIETLSSHGGMLGQKHLARELDFSKAKVSRIIRNLKERGLVSIEPVSGRENRIVLKKVEDAGSGEETD